MINDELQTSNFRDYEVFLNKNVVVMLKDNTVYYGLFISFDQYHSITLNFAIERNFHKLCYGEKFKGVVVIRGDFIAVIGPSNLDMKKYTRLEFETINSLNSVENEGKSVNVIK